MTSYDAVIVGAGHNGLTCGCYLARAGLKVLALDQYDEPGGMTITEELTRPGHWSDVHASGYLVAKLVPAPAELDLAHHGVELITPDPNWAQVFPDGTGVLVHRDPERTAKGLAARWPTDAAAWDRLYGSYLEGKPQMLAAMTAPPVTLAEQEALLGRDADRLRFELQSARSWVDQAFTEPEAKAFFGSFALHAGAAPDDAGGGQFAWMFLSVVQDLGVSIVRGGMHHVPRALVSDLEAHGGEVRTGARVVDIVTDDGRATGVRLANGEVLSAGTIVGGVDPYHAVNDLLGPDAVGQGITAKMDSYEWGDAFFTVHAVLDRPLEYAAGADYARAGYVHASGSSIDDLAQMFAECRAGLLPAAPLLGIINESGVDPSRAPAGSHLVKLVAHFTPYEIRGDATGRGITGRTWDEAREAYADHIVDLVTERYAPALRDSIVQRRAFSPLDLERRMPSAVRGTHQHGAYLPYQHGASRPIPELAHYRTPVPNVYLCSAGTHPGSGVSLGGGRNAAMTICADQRLQFPGAT